MLSRLAARVVSFLREEEGPTAIEYAVMISLIAVVCITAISLIGTETKGNFNKLNTSFTGS